MAKKYGVSFEEDVKIDKLDLANEIELTPSILQHYHERLAEARLNKDRAEAAVKQIRAEVEMTIRKGDPKLYGLEKFTEGSIASLIETDKKVLRAIEESITARNEADTLYGAVESIKTKADALKLLTTLWTGGYFAGN